MTPVAVDHRLRTLYLSAMCVRQDVVVVVVLRVSKSYPIYDPPEIKMSFHDVSCSPTIRSNGSLLHPEDEM